MRRKSIAIDLLQIAMSSILIGLGLLLKNNELFHNTAVLFLSIPGIVLIISYFLNFMTYPKHWTFTAIIFVINLLGVAGYYFRSRFQITKEMALITVFSVGITSVLATFFRLLHGDVILEKK